MPLNFYQLLTFDLRFTFNAIKFWFNDAQL